MVLMLSEEKRMAKGHALKVLDYAMMGREGMGACEKFVEVGGLKGAFKAFVGKVCSFPFSFCLPKFFLETFFQRALLCLTYFLLCFG